MLWTTEAIRAESEYRRERLHRLVGQRRAVPGTESGRTERAHRFLRWGGRPRPVGTTG